MSCYVNISNLHGTNVCGTAHDINALVQNSNRSGGEDLVCRICYEGGSKESFISPCQCIGSMQYVHIDCLERWISSRLEYGSAPLSDDEIRIIPYWNPCSMCEGHGVKKMKCEICKAVYPYKIKSQLRCLPKLECKSNTRWTMTALICLAINVLTFFNIISIFTIMAISSPRNVFGKALRITALITASGFSLLSLYAFIDNYNDLIRWQNSCYGAFMPYMDMS